MELSIANRVFGNQVLPNSIGPDIRIMIEIYFPENPTFSAHQNIGGLQFGREVKNSPKVFRIELSRGDMCRLVENKEHLRIAFRAGHKQFIEDASTEEVYCVESTWTNVACCILGKLRWRKPSLGRYGADKYINCVGQAADLLAVDFADVTDFLIGRNSSKIKAPSLAMFVRKDPYISSNLYEHLTALPRPVKLERFEEIDVDNLEFVLSIPTVLFSKTCPLVSDVESRPEVTMQVRIRILLTTCIYTSVITHGQIVVWQLGSVLGVVCYDRREREVHILQPSNAQQELLCEQAQSSGPEELSINMSLFASSFVYQEEVRKQNTDFDLLTFVWCRLPTGN